MFKCKWAKQNYLAKKYEFLAVVWAATDKFKHYLIGENAQL